MFTRVFNVERNPVVDHDKKSIWTRVKKRKCCFETYPVSSRIDATAISMHRCTLGFYHITCHIIILQYSVQFLMPILLSNSACHVVKQYRRCTVRIRTLKEFLENSTRVF